jgi:hypothetical protein
MECLRMSLLWERRRCRYGDVHTAGFLLGGVYDDCSIDERCCCEWKALRPFGVSCLLYAQRRKYFCTETVEGMRYVSLRWLSSSSLGEVVIWRDYHRASVVIIWDDVVLMLFGSSLCVDGQHSGGVCLYYYPARYVCNTYLTALLCSIDRGMVVSS